MAHAPAIDSVQTQLQELVDERNRRPNGDPKRMECERRIHDLCSRVVPKLLDGVDPEKFEKRLLEETES